MDVYIKPKKTARLSGVSEIYMRDVSGVSAPPGLAEAVGGIRLLEVPKNINKNYLISVIDMINAVKAAFPGDTVINVGEMDTLVEYKAETEPESSAREIIKVALVSLVLLAGSATAIMSFHADAQMPEIFKAYHKMFLGRETDKPLLIDIPYSLGLAFGIILFFNHFAGKSVTRDPTPIEVQTAVYDKEVSDTLIETLSKEKEKGKGKA
ncbi:MAG: stage V sporulation protein AA [Clostridiales bacterium]|jgi:stage V sporulation protein AA|nr:stage V sporulation protein AA [Clostridiales bacterium]